MDTRDWQKNALNKQAAGEKLPSFHNTKYSFDQVSVCLCVQHCHAIPAKANNTDAGLCAGR